MLIRSWQWLNPPTGVQALLNQSLPWVLVSEFSLLCLSLAHSSNHPGVYKKAGQKLGKLTKPSRHAMTICFLAQGPVAGPLEQRFSKSFNHSSHWEVCITHIRTHVCANMCVCKLPHHSYYMQSTLRLCILFNYVFFFFWCFLKLRAVKLVFTDLPFSLPIPTSSPQFKAFLLSPGHLFRWCWVSPSHFSFCCLAAAPKLFLVY